VRASSKVFNPDIAVIGDFLGAIGKNDFAVRHARPRAARGGGVTPGHRGSVRPADFF
jgi:hypothetical protein